MPMLQRLFGALLFIACSASALQWEVIDLQGSSGLRNGIELGTRFNGNYGTSLGVAVGAQFSSTADSGGMPGSPWKRLENAGSQHMRIELAVRLFELGFLTSDLYGSWTPVGKGLDPTLTFDEQLSDQDLHWNPMNWGTGLRVLLEKGSAGMTLWRVGLFAEASYNHFGLSVPHTNIAWVASGWTVQAGVTGAIGFRVGGKPVNHTLGWLKRSLFMDSAEYRQRVWTEGLADPDERVRATTLQQVNEDGWLGDVAMGDASADVRKLAFARIKDTALKARVTLAWNPPAPVEVDSDSTWAKLRRHFMGETQAELKDALPDMVSPWLRLAVQVRLQERTWAQAIDGVEQGENPLVVLEAMAVAGESAAMRAECVRALKLYLAKGDRTTTLISLAAVREVLWLSWSKDFASLLLASGDEKLAGIAVRWARAHGLETVQAPAAPSESSIRVIQLR